MSERKEGNVAKQYYAKLDLSMENREERHLDSNLHMDLFLRRVLFIEEKGS